MPYPILIGGLVMGGAMTAWRLVRERGRVQRMVNRLRRESHEAGSSRVIRLERDPKTGIYGPRKGH